MCTPFPTCQLGQVAEDSLTTLVQSAVDSLIDSVTPALTSLGTLWVTVPTPDLTGHGSTEPRGSAPDSAGVLTALGYVSWIGFAIAIMTLIILGAIIATRLRTGDGITAVGRIGAVLGAVILISSASSVVALVLPSGPQGVSGATGYIQASLWWYMAAAAMLSVIIGAIRMLWEQHARPGLDTLKSLITLIVVAGAGVAMVGILIKAADSFSGWVIDGALNCSMSDPHCFAGSVAKLLHLTNTADSYGLGSVTSVLVMVLVAVLALLSTLIQIVLLIARSGMLVILTGVLPIASSATNTGNGKNWFAKCVAWLIGFLLYKPAAAIVYAAAFKLFANDGQSSDDLISMLTGVMMMVLAVFALPAILRFVSPMAAGAAGGGASGAAAVAALAALPSGARAAGARSAGGTALGGAPTGSAPTGSAQGGSAPGGSASGGGSAPGGGSLGTSTAVGGQSDGAGAPATSGGSAMGTVGDPGPTRAATGGPVNSTSSPTHAADAGPGSPTGGATPRGRRYASTPQPEGRSKSGQARDTMLVAAQLAGGAAHSITNDTTGDGHG